MCLKSRYTKYSRSFEDYKEMSGCNGIDNILYLYTNEKLDYPMEYEILEVVKELGTYLSWAEEKRDVDDICVQIFNIVNYIME